MRRFLIIGGCATGAAFLGGLFGSTGALIGTVLGILLGIFLLRK